MTAKQAKNERLKKYKDNPDRREALLSRVENDMTDAGYYARMIAWCGTLDQVRVQMESLDRGARNG